MVAACSPEVLTNKSSHWPNTLALTQSVSLLARVRVFSDVASLRMFGLDKGAMTSGDGVIRLASNPAINSPRGQLLQYATESGTGEAVHVEHLRLPTPNIEIQENGSDVRSLVDEIWNDDTKFGDASLPYGFWQTEFVPVSGEFQYFSAHSDSVQQDEQFRSWIVDAGGGKFHFALNSTTSKTTHPYGLMVKVRTAWDEAGNLTLQSNSGPGWQQELYINNGPVQPISSLRRGIVAATRESDIRFSSTAFSRTSFAEIDHDFYALGSRLHGIDRTRATPALLLPNGMFAGQTMARVRHRRASEPVSGRTSCWKQLTDGQNSMLDIPVSDLIPNTEYLRQFEVADSKGRVLWISEPSSFKTL